MNDNIRNSCLLLSAIYNFCSRNPSILLNFIFQLSEINALLIVADPKCEACRFDPEFDVGPVEGEMQWGNRQQIMFCRLRDISVRIQATLLINVIRRGEPMQQNQEL